MDKWIRLSEEPHQRVGGMATATKFVMHKHGKHSVDWHRRGWVVGHKCPRHPGSIRLITTQGVES